MPLLELDETLKELLQSGALSRGDWGRLLDPRHFRLVEVLRAGLADQKANLPKFESLAGHATQGPARAEWRAIRLYTCVARELAAGGTMEPLMAEFGASVVADVCADLQVGAPRSPSGGDDLRPLEVEVPLALVRLDPHGNPEKGVAAGFRFEWLKAPPGVVPGTVFCIPRQMAIDRETRLGAGAIWVAAEREVLRFLRAQLSGAAGDGSKPAVLPLDGDIRWALALEDPEADFLRTVRGDSFGLAFVLGLIRLIARGTRDHPVGWSALKDLDLSGVLPMAAVLETGELRSVGGAHAKIIEVRAGFRTAIHTVVAARAQENVLRPAYDVNLQGWSVPLGLEFVFAETVEDAIGQLAKRLATLREVDEAIRRYGQKCEAEWRKDFDVSAEEAR